MGIIISNLHYKYNIIFKFICNINTIILMLDTNVDKYNNAVVTINSCVLKNISIYTGCDSLIILYYITLCTYNTYIYLLHNN